MTLNESFELTARGMCFCNLIETMFMPSQTIRASLVLLALTFSSFMATAVIAGDACVPAGSNRIRESFRIDPTLGAIILPVQLDGKKFQFLLDTGCGATVFDTALRRHLGNPTGSPANLLMQNGETASYAVPHAKIGRLSLPVSEVVVCMDLDWLRQVSGCDIDGILGNRFLRNWVVRFDFDQGRIDILEPGVGGKRSTRGSRFTSSLVMAALWQYTGQSDCTNRCLSLSTRM